MSKYARCYFIPLVTLLCIGFTSCSNNADSGNKTGTDTLAKTTWENPRKGKIWEKENIDVSDEEVEAEIESIACSLECAQERSRR